MSKKKMTDKEIKDMLSDAVITTRNLKLMIEDGRKTKSVTLKGLLRLSERTEIICRDIRRLRKRATK